MAQSVDFPDSLKMIEWVDQALAQAESTQEQEIFSHFAFKGSDQITPNWKNLIFDPLRKPDPKITQVVHIALHQLLSDAGQEVSNLPRQEDRIKFRGILQDFHTRLLISEEPPPPRTSTGTKAAIIDFINVRRTIPQPVDTTHTWLTRNPKTVSTWVLGLGGSVATIFSICTFIGVAALGYIGIGIAGATLLAFGIFWAIEGIAFAMQRVNQKKAIKAFNEASTPEQLIPVFGKLSPDTQAKLLVGLGKDFRTRVAASCENVKFLGPVCSYLNDYRNEKLSPAVRKEALEKLLLYEALGKVVHDLLLKEKAVAS